jgi:hypothetical protein
MSNTKCQPLFDHCHLDASVNACDRTLKTVWDLLFDTLAFSFSVERWAVGYETITAREGYEKPCCDYDH